MQANQVNDDADYLHFPFYVNIEALYWINFSELSPGDRISIPEGYLLRIESEEDYELWKAQFDIPYCEDEPINSIPLVFNSAEIIVHLQPMINQAPSDVISINGICRDTFQLFYPWLESPMIGSADFRDDGTLLALHSNTCYSATNEYALTINIGYMARSFSHIGGSIATVTYVNGIEVTAFVVNGEFNSDVFFLANFHIDGIPYCVLLSISDVDNIAIGKEYMSSIVNSLIANALDFSVIFTIAGR